LAKIVPHPRGGGISDFLSLGSFLSLSLNGRCLPLYWVNVAGGHPVIIPKLKPHPGF